MKYIYCTVFHQSLAHYAKFDFASRNAVYLSESNPSLWKAILTLRDHNSERRALNPDLWAKHEKPVANFVVNTCKMAPNEDIVIKIMGILATNSAHLDLEHGYGQGCALYATFALHTMHGHWTASYSCLWKRSGHPFFPRGVPQNIKSTAGLF